MRRLPLVLLALVAGGFAYWATIVRPRAPSNDRRWVLPQTRLARSERHGDTLVVHDLRRFRYVSADSSLPRWTTDTFDLATLRGVRFALAPFGPEWAGTGHAFVTFAFADGRDLAVSIEARREIGETYGLVAGLTRRFEVIYVVGDVHDVVRRRLVDGQDVFLFPVVAPPARRRELLVAMLERANALRDTPVFYNTLTDNCTSLLVRHVNTIVPGRIPSDWRTLLPGYADRAAQDIGLLADSGDPAVLRQRYSARRASTDLAIDERFGARLLLALGDTIR
jgi:hypothetical protein